MDNIGFNANIFTKPLQSLKDPFDKIKELSGPIFIKFAIIISGLSYCGYHLYVGCRVKFFNPSYTLSDKLKGIKIQAKIKQARESNKKGDMRNAKQLQQECEDLLKGLKDPDVLGDLAFAFLGIDPETAYKIAEGLSHPSALLRFVRESHFTFDPERQKQLLLKALNKHNDETSKRNKKCSSTLSDVGFYLRLAEAFSELPDSKNEVETSLNKALNLSKGESFIYCCCNVAITAKKLGSTKVDIGELLSSMDSLCKLKNTLREKIRLADAYYSIGEVKKAEKLLLDIVNDRDCDRSSDHDCLSESLGSLIHLLNKIFPESQVFDMTKHIHNRILKDLDESKDSEKVITMFLDLALAYRESKKADLEQEAIKSALTLLNKLSYEKRKDVLYQIMTGHKKQVNPSAVQEKIVELIQNIPSGCLDFKMLAFFNFLYETNYPNAKQLLTDYLKKFKDGVYKFNPLAVRCRVASLSKDCESFKTDLLNEICLQFPHAIREYPYSKELILATMAEALLSISPEKSIVEIHNFERSVANKHLAIAATTATLFSVIYRYPSMAFPISMGSLLLRVVRVF